MATYNVERKFVFGGFYSPSLLLAWRAQQDLFDRVEGYDAPTVPYQADDGSETVAAAIVTPGLFSMLDAAPERGRLFVPGEGGNGTADAVVISDAFWRSKTARRSRRHRAPARHRRPATSRRRYPA